MGRLSPAEACAKLQMPERTAGSVTFTALLLHGFFVAQLVLNSAGSQLTGLMC